MFAILGSATLVVGGILGTRGTVMLDLLFLAQFVVVPVMLFGILQARRRKYHLHKRVMLVLVGILAVVVAAFEVNIQVYGWEQHAEGSPYYSTPVYASVVGITLLVHLSFAVSTAVLWVVVVTRALRNFPKPPHPGAHSRWHRRWAKIAAIDMLLTAVTGCFFYYIAFAAT